MNWEDRKFIILNAIIHDYIKTAEPVGSRTLEKKYNLGVSSATIRNEMSDLEDMGLLIKPHTSSGRIPSTMAYRLYVDNFMKNIALDDKIRDIVKAEYENYMFELNKTIEQTLNILTKMTNYTSLVMAPRLSSLNVKDVKLVYIEEKRVMIIVVTKEGLIRNAEIRLKNSVTIDQLEKINNALITIIRNRPAKEVVGLLGKVIDGLSEDENRILSEIMPVFRSLVEKTHSSKIYSKGVSKILNYPEFEDLEKAKHFIDSVNSKDTLENAILSAVDDDKDIHIVIGNENKVEDFSDCSIITADYKLNGKPIGTIGVIGPTRMNYDYAISTLDVLSDELTKHISKIFEK